MFHNLIFKRRKGISGLVEIIVALVIFSLLMIIIGNLISITAKQSLKVELSYLNSTRYVDIIETIKSDIISSESFDVQNNILSIHSYDSSEGYVIYKFENGNLYRDHEIIVSNLESFLFDKNAAGNLTISFQNLDGDKYFFTVR